MPFVKANRNETFSNDDLARLAPAYTKTPTMQDPDRDLKTLRLYLQEFRSKQGKVEESKDNGKKPDDGEERKIGKNTETAPKKQPDLKPKPEPAQPQKREVSTKDSNLSFESKSSQSSKGGPPLSRPSDVSFKSERSSGNSSDGAQKVNSLINQQKN